MFPSKISRRSSDLKRVDPSPHLEPSRWVPDRPRGDVVDGRETMDVVDERCARAHDRSDRHHKTRRSYVRPPIFRRDSAYASEEEAEKTMMAQSDEQVYANVPVREKNVRRSAAAHAAAWDDPAEEVDLDFSVDDEDDVKPIGDRIPSRHDGPSYPPSIWDHPLPSHLRNIFTRRPNVLRRSKEHGVI